MTEPTEIKAEEQSVRNGTYFRPKVHGWNSGGKAIRKHSTVEKVSHEIYTTKTGVFAPTLHGVTQFEVTRPFVHRRKGAEGRRQPIDGYRFSREALLLPCASMK